MAATGTCGLGRDRHRSAGALWHLPLYFIAGSYQHGLGFGSARFWFTNVGLVGLALLYVWLVNGSGGSILLAVLAHAGTNTAGELLPRSTTGDVVAFLVVTAAAVGVIAVTRAPWGLDPGTQRRLAPDGVIQQPPSRVPASVAASGGPSWMSTCTAAG